MTDDKGTYLQYIPKNFKPEGLKTIAIANAIIAEYEAAGMALTLRQLYYQFVSRDILPNNIKEYKRLGDIVSDGRLAGLISWTAIIDTERPLRGLDFSESPADALKQAREAYRIDLWANQHMRPEVRVEKNALLGVIGPVCQELRIDYTSCKGYSSQSEQWRAGCRMAEYYRKGQRPIVFYLGDHDPSGIDMTRDNEERLSMFAGVPVTVKRLALNFDQIEKYKPPENPAKMTDSRAASYVEEFGEASWELDALDPKVIADLIRQAVHSVRDPKLWAEMMDEEASDLDTLDRMIEQFGDK